MKHLIFTISMLLCAVINAMPQTKQVDADNANIRYEGRVNFTDAKARSVSCPGTVLQEILQKLRDTDYIAIKIAEGAVEEYEQERYEEIKAQRKEWRDQVNALRASQQALTAKISEANA